MSEHNKHDDEAEKEIRRIVETEGWFVAYFEATEYLPSFGFTIGLWQNFKHPELICFGLPEETMYTVLNTGGEVVSDGQQLEPAKTSDEFFEGSNAYILEVHPDYLKSYFGYGLSFYGEAFPAYQIVWGDDHHKFPWQEGFEEIYLYHQPLLDRDLDFKFREPRDLSVFTTRHHLELGSPIVYVEHDEDGDWQFLTDDELTDDDARVLSLEDMLQRDPSLNELFDLDYGEFAKRAYKGDEWVRGEVEPE